MAAILFRTGRHREQQPRTFGELPDATVTSVADLARALDGIITLRAHG